QHCRTLGKAAPHRSIEEACSGLSLPYSKQDPRGRLRYRNQALWLPYTYPFVQKSVRDTGNNQFGQFQFPWRLKFLLAFKSKLIALIRKDINFRFSFRLRNKNSKNAALAFDAYNRNGAVQQFNQRL